MFYFKVQRPCLHAAKSKICRGETSFSVWKVCHYTLVWPLTQPSQPSPVTSLNHATWNPSRAKPAPSRRRVWWALCTGADHARPTAVPLRCKQHCVCHLQFRERPFCDRPRSVPVSACQLFCFLLGDEESCPFSFNKQTAVWINKLKGSGCGPVRTVCSVRLSVCLSCERAWGAPCPNCIGPKPAHNGLLHINRFVSLVQH